MATYYAILTTAGQNALAAAEAGGSTVSISSFAVGDSNGNYYEPNQSQTALVHQVWSGSVTRVYTHPSNPNWIVAEALIPASSGGFDIREAGIFAGSTMIAVGKYPLTQKPAPGSGSEKDLYIRLIINVTNAATVTQNIDDSVVHYTISDWNKQPFKLSCRAATTANITLSGTQTIDGVTLVANDRVLVKNQTTGSQNGIYVVQSGAWYRAYDFDNALELPGAIIPVREGTVSGDSIWMLSTDGTITLGSTSLAFVSLSGKSGVAAGTYTKVTVDSYGTVTSGANPTTLAGYGITDAQPLDSDLTAIANLSTTGIINRTGAGTASTIGFGSGNVASTIVQRDSSGNFSAGVVTGTRFVLDNGLADGGEIVFNSFGYTALSVDNLNGNLRVFDSAELFKVYSTSGNVWAKGSATFGGSITAVNGTNEVDIVLGNQSNTGYVYGSASSIGLYSSTSGNQVDVGKNATSGILVKTGNATGTINLATDTTTRVQITSSGRVLMGVSLPTDNTIDALQVNGTVSLSDPTTMNQAATANYAISMAIALG